MPGFACALQSNRPATYLHEFCHRPRWLQGGPGSGGKQEVSGVSPAAPTLGAAARVSSVEPGREQRLGDGARSFSGPFPALPRRRACRAAAGASGKGRFS